ncbi:MAG: HDIG domain-containing protein [Vicinamibacterales bacterium]
MTVSRDAAWQLLTEWTQGESLRKHALAVEAAVRGYARQQGANEEEWGVAALLHDFDYERYPTLGDHPNKGCEHLRSLGYPEWVMRAISPTPGRSPASSQKLHWSARWSPATRWRAS